MFLLYFLLAYGNIIIIFNKDIVVNFNHSKGYCRNCIMDNLINKIDKNRFKNGNILRKYEILFRNR